MDNLFSVGPLAMHKTRLKQGTMAGEVAVVTGGTGNVGLGTARSLAWLGARVVLSDVNPERGQAAEQLINSETTPGTALFVQADASSEAAMNTVAEKAMAAYGKVDVLVITAMDMSLGAPILKSTVHQLDRQYEITARGTLIAIQRFVPGMQQRRHGTVAYMSTAFRYPVGPSNYCAAKSAATSIMMSLANELGPFEGTGVSVFTFLPAGVGFPISGVRRQPDQPRSFEMAPDMPGYSGMVPPEDGGAALAYCITRASELHGSGVTIGQAFRQMDWPYPKPETVKDNDFERIDDMALSLVFTCMGPGFPESKASSRPIARGKGTTPP